MPSANTASRAWIFTTQTATIPDEPRAFEGFASYCAWYSTPGYLPHVYYIRGYVQFKTDRNLQVLENRYAPYDWIPVRLSNTSLADQFKKPPLDRQTRGEYGIRNAPGVYVPYPSKHLVTQRQLGGRPPRLTHEYYNDSEQFWLNVVEELEKERIKKERNARRRAQSEALVQSRIPIPKEKVVDHLNAYYWAQVDNVNRRHKTDIRAFGRQPARFQKFEDYINNARFDYGTRTRFYYGDDLDDLDMIAQQTNKFIFPQSPPRKKRKLDLEHPPDRIIFR